MIADQRKVCMRVGRSCIGIGIGIVRYFGGGDLRDD